MKKVRIKASEVVQAMEQAKAMHDDWQAECLEILLLPAVHERWRELIGSRFPDPNIQRHDGLPHKGYKREQNLAVEDWTTIAGYVFSYGREGYTWNRTREDYYGHSPSTAWDGVRRETRCGFVNSLRLLTLKAMGATNKRCNHLYPMLDDADIEFVDDLTVPLFSLYKQGWGESQSWYLRAVDLSSERAMRQIANGKRQQPGAAFAIVPWDKVLRHAPQEIEEHDLPETAERF